MGESKGINVRGFEDCIPRPPCPQGIDFRSQSEWVPGKNCKLVKDEPIPFCEDEDESKGINVRGFEDCIPRPPCPQGIDFRSQTEWVPGKNCKLVKEKPEELPPCPQGIDFRSQSKWVLGK